MVETQSPAAPNVSNLRERGFLFSGLLTVLTIGAIATAYYAVRETPIILEQNPDAPAWALWSKTALSVVNVALLGAVWMWKRWGLFGLAGTSIVLYVINGIVGYGWDSSATGFTPLILLVLLIWYRKLWPSFR